jgi:ribosome-associated protein
MAVKRSHAKPMKATPTTPKAKQAVKKTPGKTAARAKAPARTGAAAKSATRPAAGKSAARPKAPAKTARRAPLTSLQQVVLDALHDMKAVDVKALDVRGLTDITDTMVVASGTSDRHVKSIADRVVQRCKEAGFRPYGLEGERDGEWVLLDLQDVVLHVMLPRVREFYALEKLWEGGAPARRA